MLGKDRVYATLVDDANLKALKESRTLNVYFGGADGEGIPFGSALHWPPFGPSWSRATIDHVALKMTDEQLGRLVQKQALQLALQPRRVAFRAVSASGVGVPLAEASIIPLEDEKIALRLKEREAALAEKSKRPTIEQLEKALAGGARSAD
jgi:hypothetical protein